MKNINENSIFSRAFLRDRKTLYETDAMLIAVLAHTHALNRSGRQGDIVRQLLDDINLEA